MASDGTDEGTQRQKVLQEQLRQFCEANDLRMLPGVLDFG